MARYDIETFLDEIESTLKGELNDKISQINTEKNDSIILPSIDNAAYFFQELNGETINYDPFILYGIEDITTVSVGPSSAQRITISVIIVVADHGDDLKIAKKMLRYSKALRETFQENWAICSAGYKIEIKSLVPQSFQRLNSSEFYRAVGVEIETSIP